MDTVAIFQARRYAFNKAIRTLLFSAFITDLCLFAALYFMDTPTGFVSYLLPLIGLTLFVVVLGIIVTTYKIYRCPHCNSIPKTLSANGGSIDMNPSECSTCGAQLNS